MRLYEHTKITNIQDKNIVFESYKDKVIPDYKHFLRLDKHTKIQDKIIILLRPKKKKHNNQMYLKMRKIREKIVF